MTNHTVAQTLTNIRQTIVRYAWWLGLSLVLVVTALGGGAAIADFSRHKITLTGMGIV